MKNLKTILNEYISLILEKKIKEADVSDGSKVPFGSQEHIQDLERRILDLSRWRNLQKRGSEARANYSRIISRLKNELLNAKKRIESSIKG